ncbi:MAG: Bax inhibitor-1/YccA family protein [Bdellovibrionales bacterium]|nr:Bax inhibitor-1/YccA family protein [Bdellovibrionales bacterium]
MRTSNPALSDKAFGAATAVSPTDRMTIQGTVNKTGVLLLLVIAAASYTWREFYSTWDPSSVAPWIWVGAFGGFAVAMVTIFKKEWAPITAPLYAVLEGLFLGAVSATFEAQYPGIVIQAVGLTFGTLLALLAAYKSQMIRATENFKLGVVAATGGICLLYFVSIVLGFFGIPISFIHSSGTAGILFSVFVVVIAALNLVLDFDFIENAAYRGVPKHMEWYGAFGLLVTLVWLYLEILRLLAKSRRR